MSFRDPWTSMHFALHVLLLHQLDERLGGGLGLVVAVAAHVRGRLGGGGLPVEGDERDLGALRGLDRGADGRRVLGARHDEVDALVDEVLDVGGLPGGIGVGHVDDPLERDVVLLAVGLAELLQLVGPGLDLGVDLLVVRHPDRITFGFGAARAGPAMDMTTAVTTEQMNVSLRIVALLLRARTNGNRPSATFLRQTRPLHLSFTSQLLRDEPHLPRDRVLEGVGVHGDEDDTAADERVDEG